MWCLPFSGGRVSDTDWTTTLVVWPQHFKLVLFWSVCLQHYNIVRLMCVCQMDMLTCMHAGASIGMLQYFIKTNRWCCMEHFWWFNGDSFMLRSSSLQWPPVCVCERWRERRNVCMYMYLCMYSPVEEKEMEGGRVKVCEWMIEWKWEWEWVSERERERERESERERGKEVEETWGSQ